MHVADDGYTRYTSLIFTDYMRLVLDSPEQAKRLMLSENQAKLVNMIRAEGTLSVTARRMADEERVSIQSMSSRLATLWQRGYLERRSSIDETGGIIYLYRSVVRDED